MTSAASSATLLSAARAVESASVASGAAARAAVTHAPYRREPYVRFHPPASTVDGFAVEGFTIDGKAAAWTRTSVLLHWIDEAGRAHNRWVPAKNVRRVAREDSAWQDPYDDWSFYYPDLSLRQVFS